MCKLIVPYSLIKRLMIFLAIMIAGFIITSCSENKSKNLFVTEKDDRLKYDTALYQVIKHHRQLYSMSCIPSAIELILKLNKKVDPNYFQLQEDWKEKADGTFADFDGKTIEGMIFTHHFKDSRDVKFPFEKLYKTIEAELKEGRNVIISLPSGPGLWHMYIIGHQSADGDFIAYSRVHNVDSVFGIDKVKEKIEAVSGTDILTYREVR